MEAIKEITAWKDGTTANHTYLLDGNNLVAYIKKKGNSYFVDDEAHTCTCPGFTFRGSCKHVG